MTAKKHYDNHWGNFYSWMIGDLETKQTDLKSSGFPPEQQIKTIL
jgi:hypothetical protein